MVKDRVAQTYPEKVSDGNYINDNFFTCVCCLTLLFHSDIFAVNLLPSSFCGSRWLLLSLVGQKFQQTQNKNWQALTSLKAFKRLQQYVMVSFQQFFHSLGIKQSNEVHPSDLYFWFSVHTDNSDHEPHVHDDSSAAAVFYLQVPADAGK